MDRLQNRYDDTEKWLLAALKDRHLKLGDAHPRTIESMKNLMDLYVAWNEPKEAEKWRAKLEQIEDFEE